MTVEDSVEHEWGLAIIRYIRDHYPELLKKTIALSEDEVYRNVAKDDFSVEAFDAYMAPIEQKRFKVPIIGFCNFFH